MQKRGTASHYSWTEWVEFDRLTSWEAIDEIRSGVPFRFAHLIPEPPRHPVVGGLFGLSLDQASTLKTEAEEREQRLQDRSGTVRSHPMYKRLSKDHNFAAAIKVFKTHRRKASDSVGYGDPYAELHFLNIVAGAVVRQDRWPNLRPRHASLRLRSEAIDSAKKLLHAIDGGVQFERWIDDEALKRLLLALCHRLEGEVQAGKRKRRDDALASQRWHLEQLIARLHITFGSASPTIVSSVAAMMGYDVETSTIERRIAAARKSALREREAGGIVASLV